jgi:hypothetical protein
MSGSTSIAISEYRPQDRDCLGGSGVALHWNSHANSLQGCAHFLECRLGRIDGLGLSQDVGGHTDYAEADDQVVPEAIQVRLRVLPHLRYVKVLRF